jgi:hypothetical protein
MDEVLLVPLGRGARGALRGKNGEHQDKRPCFAFAPVAGLQPFLSKFSYLVTVILSGDQESHAQSSMPWCLSLDSAS